MSNETIFFIFGTALAVSAVTVSLLGLRLKNFPGRAFPLVILWFAILVVGATTFAVLHAKDEDKAKAAEFEQAGKEVEGDQTGTPFEEEGSAGGESKAAGGESGAGGTEGSAKGKPASGAGGTLQLAADPTQIAYDTTSLASKPGKVTIDFTNPSALEHDVAIEAEDGKEIATSPLIGKGKTTVSANLAPGTYHFFCTVPGHREAGMEGTLVVK